MTEAVFGKDRFLLGLFGLFPAVLYGHGHGFDALGDRSNHNKHHEQKDEQVLAVAVDGGALAEAAALLVKLPAGAVGADEAHCFARVDVKRDILQEVILLKAIKILKSI